MAQRDGKSEIQTVHLGNLALSGTTPAASAWLDTRGFDKATLVVVANTVTAAGASGFSFEVQESDTTAAADATAVADAQLLGSESDLTVTANDDNLIVGGIGYIGSQRYVRIVATGTTSTDADVSIVAVAGDASYEPRAFVGTSVAAT